MQLRDGALMLVVLTHLILSKIKIVTFVVQWHAIRWNRAETIR
jgi:hypothetical protein